MANRYLHQFPGAFEKGITLIHAKITIGSTGAPTLVTSSGAARGVASVSRTAAGRYTLTLSDKYNAFRAGIINHISSTLQGLIPQITAETVATNKTVAFALMPGAIAGARSVDAGIAEVQTITCLAQASCTDRDYVVVTDASGNQWAIYLDKTGTSVAPTGAIYTAIPAARKGKADISGSSTADQVATVVAAAFNALTGFTAQFTMAARGGSTGIIDSTCVFREDIPAPVPKNLDDSGAGTIGGATTTAGRFGAVSVANDTITIPSHRFKVATEVKVYGSSDVPAPLVEGTSYYVIAFSTDTIKLATSAANAIAGTAINISGDATANSVLQIVPVAQAIDPTSGDEIHVTLWCKNSSV